MTCVAFGEALNLVPALRNLCTYSFPTRVSKNGSASRCRFGVPDEASAMPALTAWLSSGSWRGAGRGGAAGAAASFWGLGGRRRAGIAVRHVDVQVGPAAGAEEVVWAVRRGH